MVLPVLAPLPGSRPLDLREANLFAGQFAAADLTDGDLRRADLQLANLAGATLRGARLTWADLTRAVLTGADLRNADLAGADLSGADLRDADLRGAALDGANLQHAQVAGARGLPDALHFVDGIVPGPTAPGHADEPQAGLDAFARARTLHAAGRLAHAERAYRVARAWQPQSDIVPYALACLSLDRDDPDGARDWLLETLRVEPDADRARLELALLQHATGHWTEAEALLAPLRHRLPELTALALENAEPVLRRLAGHTALVAWLDRRSVTDAPAAQSEPPAATGHARVAAAIAAGDLPAAQRELRQMTNDEPLAALWRLLLPKLRVTGEAFDALLATRQPAIDAASGLRWQSLGAHATTARLETPHGVLWAQRVAGPLRSAASLDYTHALQEHLGALGHMVPHWLTDRADAPQLAFDGDWLVVAHDLTGQPLVPTVAECVLAGRTLAAIHNAPQQSASRPPGGLRAGVDLLSAPHPGAAWLAEMTAEPQLWARLVTQPLHARVPPLLDLVTRRIHAPLGQCPRGLCHGDFAPQNLLLRPDGQLAVLDWDLADLQPLVWDLARALDVFAVRWSPRAADPPQIDWPRLRALLDGYQQVRPLLPDERAVLPILIAASRLDIDTGLLTLLAPLDPDVVDTVLPRLHARLVRAAAGVPELAALIQPG